jgi:hypothetical protein
VDRYSFIVMDSHHLLFAGLPAHPIPAVRCGSEQGVSSTLSGHSALAMRTAFPSPDRAFAAAA